jgi:hypothetical protein
MTNIEKALLSNVYPHVDIQLLEEVINATPNTAVATEILCGIYSEPEVPQMVNKDDKKTIVYHMTKYNKWKDTVDYTYQTPKCIGGFYFPNTVKREDINESNYEELRMKKNDEGKYDHDNYYHVYVDSLTVMETKYSDMDLARWMKLHEANPICPFEHLLDKHEAEMEAKHLVQA